MIEQLILMLGSKKYWDDISDYVVSRTNGLITLSYSNSPKWTHRNKPAYTLSDDGNGLTFQDKITKKSVRLSYCEAEALRALLKLYDKENDSTFKLYKEVK